MSNVFGVTFKDKGKSYYFKTTKPLDLKIGDNVVVEAEKGQQFGKINLILDKEKVIQDHEELREIVRIATKEDYDQYLKNLKSNIQALNNAKAIAEELKLRMILIDANWTFDKKQLLLNFTADERVDFRELAKRMAGIYRTRIELRQIGARDKAKEISGIGQCGRALCCANFLHRIDGVTINMAKNQSIALNPTKINGQCGRLLCCLTYENEEYVRCSYKMPYVGEEIKTEDGNGKVLSVDILNRKYIVDVNGEKKEVKLGDI